MKWYNRVTQANLRSLPWTIILPFIIYLIHGWFLRDWIIDDAGISFVYSRHLAQGYGLVSQPGVEPVEGYSNFTWVLILVPFFWFNLFDPFLTPKLLSLFLVMLSFITIHKILRLIFSENKIYHFIILTLLAINTPFVVWTVSGLENPLYTYLIVLMLYQLIKISSTEQSPFGRVVFTLGVLSALIAMTRPDGLLYFFLLPTYLIFDLVFYQKRIRPLLTSLLLYTFVFFIIYGSFLLFRIYYFGDFFPNTYYAKGGPSLNTLIKLFVWHPDVYSKLYWLLKSVVSYLSGPFFILLCTATAYFLLIRNYTKSDFVVLLVMLCSTAIYILLPYDLFREYRFATPFYISFYIYLVILWQKASQIFRWEPQKKVAMTFIVFLLFIVGSLGIFARRTYQFVLQPSIPFTLVSELLAKRFNDYARELAVTNGSFLVPDAGGTLYYSTLKIYDLGKLTDKTIARTLAKEPDKFHHYVFEEIKPTFIHTHGLWTYLARFDKAPQFRTDYIPIQERIDEWVLKKHGLELFSGDYVRRDAIENKLHLLEQLQNR